MKTVRIRAGHNKRIAYFGDGMGQVLEFRAEADAGGAPAGKIEVKRKGMFGFKSEFRDLRPENSITIGRLTYQNSISVVPDADTTITITKGVKSLGEQIRFALRIGIVIGIGLIGAFVASQLGLLSAPQQGQTTGVESAPQPGTTTGSDQ